MPIPHLDTLIATLTDDYRRFPEAQTYDLYRPDVLFRDPVYHFRGLDRYQKMIRFITYWFRQLRLELHHIEPREADQPPHIRTEWTMSWTAPLPWQPRIAVTGWTELHLDSDGKIAAHLDYWHCTKWDVLQQHFRFFSPQG
jgi:hypothetical protein